MMNEQIRRVYRSRDERIVAGVCGGLGEYFRIDPVIIRILWVSSFLALGTGIVAYIIAVLIIPEEN